MDEAVRRRCGEECSGAVTQALRANLTCIPCQVAAPDGNAAVHALPLPPAPCRLPRSQASVSKP